MTTLTEKLAPPSMPRAAGWPLVGSLPALLTRPFAFFDDARRRHGDLYEVSLGPLKAVVLGHPDHAQHVLRDRAANYRKGGAIWDSIRALVGDGLVVSEGDFWLRQRRMMQPQFHRQRLAALTDLMVRAIDHSLTGWLPAAAAGRPVDLLPKYNHLTMRVVVDTLFGASVPREALDDVADAMGFALNYIMVGAVTRSLPAWLPIPGRRRFHRDLARFDRVVYDVIAAARRGEGGENHLLAMLLDVVDAETGAGMSDSQLRDEVATLLLAGYETTSIALCWATHFLTEHPDVLARLQAEVDAALGGRLPTFADLPKLPYARMVLQEVLRLRPPSYWVPRVAAEDDVIDGVEIPAGTDIISFTYMIHRHPDVWPDPERFDPERFAGDHSGRGVATRHPFAWIPFGAGQRLCIGRDFAMMEGTLALAMLAQRFHPSAVPGRPARLGLSTTLRPRDGLWVKLAARA